MTKGRYAERTGPLVTPFTAELISVRRFLFFLRCERSREIDEHRAEVRAVAEEVGGTAATGEQKSDRREISFGRVAGFACENEIVAPIVRRLPASWRHVIECHRGLRESLAAVRAHRAMLVEEPS